MCSLKCDKKAATLSQVIEPKMYERYYGDPGAMGELRNVQRGVYNVQNRGENMYREYEQVSLPAISKIVVVYNVVVESKSVKKSVKVKDMSGVPLSLTRDSVTEGSGDYSDKEEVLEELSEKLGCLSSYQEVTELRGGRAEERGQGVQREGWEEEGQEGQVGEKMCSLERCR